MIKHVSELVSDILEATYYNPNVDVDSDKTITIFTSHMPPRVFGDHRYTPDYTVIVKPLAPKTDDDPCRLEINRTFRIYGIVEDTVRDNSFCQRRVSLTTPPIIQERTFNPTSYASMCDLATRLIRDAYEYTKEHSAIYATTTVLLSKLEELRIGITQSSPKEFVSSSPKEG